MAGIITKNFRVHNAKQFKEQFDEQDPSNVYFFISRPVPWTDDSNPPIQTDNINDVEYLSWNYMLGMKKIAGSDAVLSAPRYDWTSGTVYEMYKANASFSGNAFYVVTDDYNVYKCLNNNNGAPSTVKPSGTLPYTFTTSDGYQWKYMYSITASDALKFLTTTYIPVRTLTADNGSTQWNVQNSAANGSIEVVTVTGGGSGYQGMAGTIGSATSTTVTLPIGANTTNGVYNKSTIYILGGVGAGQMRDIVGYNGGTRTLTVNNAFSTIPDAASSFVISPKIVASGGGKNFKAYATVNTNRQVTGATVVDRGQNYSAPNITFQANSGIGATAIAHISPHGGHGKDPESELYAHNVTMNIRLTGSESGNFPVANDYRIFGLLVDPKLETGGVANSAVFDMRTKINLSTVGGTFAKDELITGQTSGATAYLVEYMSNTQISVTGTTGEFSTAEVISGSTSSATATVGSVIKPLVKKYTGSVLYIENRTPISRAPDQSEDIKAIAKF